MIENIWVCSVEAAGVCGAGIPEKEAVAVNVKVEPTLAGSEGLKTRDGLTCEPQVSVLVRTQSMTHGSLAPQVAA